LSVSLVRLSDSFESAVTALLESAGASVVPAGASMVLLLAGGAEAEALAWLDAAPHDAPCVRWVIGSVADHRLATAVVQRGAQDYFALPGDFDLLRRTLERTVREHQAASAAQTFAAGERTTSGFDVMLGRSPSLAKALALGRRVAAHRDVTVMIGGETGTGKELLARAIHYEGPRAAAPFVEINCTAIPANLLESELFGHEKGSFTGATSAKPGLFEVAHGGTVFLDEIGHLPIDLQPKLLRALESRQIRRVGGSETRNIDVRIIAATHVNLELAVQQGTFREDLYYRLNVVTLTLPPLRERAGDVPLLAEAFAAQLARRYGLSAPTITATTHAVLEAYPWPGNVRELRNAIERALVLSPPGELDPGELLLRHGPAGTASRPAREGPATEAATAGPLPFPATISEIVHAAATAMLARTGGNKSDAARQLNISRPRLQRLLDGQEYA